MKNNNPIGLALRSLGSLVVIGTLLLGCNASAQMFYTTVGAYDTHTTTLSTISFSGTAGTYTTKSSPYSVTSYLGYTTTFTAGSDDSLAIYGSGFETPAGPAALDVSTS